MICITKVSNFLGAYQIKCFLFSDPWGVINILKVSPKLVFALSVGSLSFLVVSLALRAKNSSQEFLSRATACDRPFDSPLNHGHQNKKASLSTCFFVLVTRGGIEPPFPA